MPTTFHCTADLANLAAIRSFIHDNAQPVCADEDFLYDLMLAVDEVVTNIIVHGYRKGPGDITIEIQPQAGAVAVVIKDNAPSFDPRSAPEPNLNLPLERRKPGGMGIAIVRKRTDHMMYAPGLPSGNELTLIKRCPNAGCDSGT